MKCVIKAREFTFPEKKSFWKNKKSKFIFTISLICLLSFNNSLILGEDEEINLRTKEELNKIQPDDKVLGCNNAPHTLFQYSSMTCPHCAEFMRTEFKAIKNNLIDTCKLRFVYRELPNNSGALIAGSLAHCLYVRNNSIEIFFKAVNTMYSTLESWAMHYDPSALREVMVFNGYDDKEVDYCLNNKVHLNHVMERGYEYQKVMDIRYTPFFVFDGKVLAQTLRYKELEEMVNGKTKKDIGK